MVRKIRINEDTNFYNDKIIDAIADVIYKINTFCKNNNVELKDMLNVGSKTFNFADEFENYYGGLDADAIITDYKENDNPYWDPRDYLFNILVYVMNISYDEAEKLLLHKL